MSGTTGIAGDADVRAATARAARSYDLVPYKPRAKGSPGLDPMLLFGIAGVYGEFWLRGDIDVLDLGCGSGGQLLRVGDLTTGRLVGVDISSVACQEAVKQCAPLGGRCAIHCKDLFDLDTGSLGQFDLIYVLGVYFVVPPAVQQRLIAVASACLKPGGVLVISYYAGEVWRQYDVMRRAVQAAVDRAAPHGEQVRAARARIHDLAAAGTGTLLSRMAGHTLGGDETAFFHEMMGEFHSPAKTVDLEMILAPAGIHFLNWLEPGPFTAADPMGRASAADRASQGGYFYGVFGKYDPAKSGDWNGLSWITNMRRAGVSGYGVAVFQDASSGKRLEVANSTTAAALDLLARGPCRWEDMLKAMAAMPAGLAYLASVKRDFVSFWHAGALTPLAVA